MACKHMSPLLVLIVLPVVGGCVLSWKPQRMGRVGGGGGGTLGTRHPAQGRGVFNGARCRKRRAARCVVVDVGLPGASMEISSGGERSVAES